MRPYVTLALPWQLLGCPGRWPASPTQVPAGHGGRWEGEQANGAACLATGVVGSAVCGCWNLGSLAFGYVPESILEKDPIIGEKGLSELKFENTTSSKVPLGFLFFLQLHCRVSTRVHMPRFDR